MTVHNHGTEDGPGLACPETRINGKLKGKCMNAQVIQEAALAAAWEALHESRVNLRSPTRSDLEAALEAAAPHMKPPVTDEAFGYAVSAIRGHGEFTTAEAEAAVQDIINALGMTK